MRAHPVREAKPIFLDITIPSCLEVASNFTVLLKPNQFLLTRTPTKATVTADFSFLIMFVLSNKNI